MKTLLLLGLLSAAASAQTPLTPGAKEAARHFTLGSAAINSIVGSCAIIRVAPLHQNEYDEEIQTLITAMNSAEEQRKLATDALAALTPQDAYPIGGWVLDWLKRAKGAVSCLHSIQNQTSLTQALGPVDPRFDSEQQLLTDGTFETLHVAAGLYGKAVIEPIERDLIYSLHH